MADVMRPMGETRQIPREQWKDYFDRFSRNHLIGEEETEAVTIEVMSPRIGDQIEAQAVPLLGLAYDPKDNALDIELEDAEHLLYNPASIWAIEEEDGFISILEVNEEDGSSELLHIYRSGPPAPLYEPSPTPPG